MLLPCQEVRSITVTICAVTICVSIAPISYTQVTMPLRQIVPIVPIDHTVLIEVSWNRRFIGEDLQEPTAGDQRGGQRCAGIDSASDTGYLRDSIDEERVNDLQATEEVQLKGRVSRKVDVR